MPKKCCCGELCTDSICGWTGPWDKVTDKSAYNFDVEIAGFTGPDTCCSGRDNPGPGPTVLNGTHNVTFFSQSAFGTPNTDCGRATFFLDLASGNDDTAQVAIAVNAGKANGYCTDANCYHGHARCSWGCIDAGNQHSTSIQDECCDPDSATLANCYDNVVDDTGCIVGTGAIASVTFNAS